MDKEQICPIFALIKAIELLPPGTSPYCSTSYTDKCIKEKCSWWNETLKTCAINPGQSTQFLND